MADIFNKSTGGIKTVWFLVKYNRQEVQDAIKKDISISKKEAKLIHALLKGRYRR